MHSIENHEALPYDIGVSITILCLVFAALLYIKKVECGISYWAVLSCVRVGH